MSLSPEENILTKEMESWRGFANGLKSEEAPRPIKNMFSALGNTSKLPFINLL
jgi:hypothetical protein